MITPNPAKCHLKDNVNGMSLKDIIPGSWCWGVIDKRSCWQESCANRKLRGGCGIDPLLYGLAIQVGILSRSSIARYNFGKSKQECVGSDLEMHTKPRVTELSQCLSYRRIDTCILPCHSGLWIVHDSYPKDFLWGWVDTPGLDPG